MAVPLEKTDAGLREQDHYKSRLPWWRYSPRQLLLPLIRYETPYVAALQQSMRSPFFDSYFSITANLGTHTFFMIFLPVLFWCGYPLTGRAMVQDLGAGVFLTGVVKDLLCLPRPLSPPLKRITMSHSVALEYGFPSTHSCNALSVVIYILMCLNDPQTSIDPTLKMILEVFAGTYAVSIVLGRLYCGMHGFLDVIIGSAMGAGIALVQYNFIEAFDDWFLSGGIMKLLIVFALALLAIRAHPEPADDCPCFDDSVAFVAVIFGIELGGWYHAQYFSGPIHSYVQAIPFDLEKSGLLVAGLRIFIGIACVIIWRSTAKATLLRVLPPVFRLFGRAGFLLPRRFFKQAPDYDRVPSGIQMDTLIPPLSKLPSFVKSIAHPGRNRSVSVGPQSAADAYEAIAYRQKVRRESRDKLASPLMGPRARAGHADEMTEYFAEKPGISTGTARSQMPVTPASSNTTLHNGLLGPSSAVLETPLTPADSNQGSLIDSRSPSADRREKEEERAVFVALPKPRTKFDIEIATKLVVYTGIAFLVSGALPYIFPMIGLQ